ncbi:hypothetical protein AWJ02_01465 [Listeria monocytogenes]|nr:hypothetical protein AWJ02_01465 [Listeria monocytogenes]
MLDLQQLQAKTIDIKWIDGTLLCVNQPTVSIVKKIESSDGKLEAFVNILHEIVNNNASGRKFDKKEIEKLPLLAIKALASEIANFKDEADNHPN